MSRFFERPFRMMACRCCDASWLDGVAQRDTAAKAVIMATTISGNNAAFGGGFMNLNATSSIVNSTISGNMTTSLGDGFVSVSDQAENEAHLLVLQSTITQNSTGAGGAVDSDTVNYGVGWKVEPPQIVEGQFVHILRQPNETIKVVNTTPFRTPLRSGDVNFDGSVSPLDALIIINQLNTNRPTQLVAPTSVAGLTDFFYVDANSDGFIVPLDVLIIVNFLNTVGSRAEGEFAIPGCAWNFRALEYYTSAVATLDEECGAAFDHPAVVGNPKLPEMRAQYENRSQGGTPNPSEAKDDDLISAIDAFLTNFSCRILELSFDGDEIMPIFTLYRNAFSHRSPGSRFVAHPWFALIGQCPIAVTWKRLCAQVDNSYVSNPPGNNLQKVWNPDSCWRSRCATHPDRPPA